MNTTPPETIETVGQLESIITSWESKFFDSGKGFPPIWYRGHSVYSWQLEPGVLRPDFQQMVRDGEYQHTDNPVLQTLIRERTINKQFLRMGASLFPRDTTLTEKYFLAQHHGLPTRLLDWTTNPLAALYFAVSSHHDVDGAVFVANPRHLIPTARNDQDSPFPPDAVEAYHPLLQSLVDYVCGREKLDFAGQPFALPILPDLSAGRMLNQGSCFTFHMPDAVPIENLIGHSRLEKYCIPKQAKPTIRNILRRMHVTESTLFADLDHLTKDIKIAYGLR